MKALAITEGPLRTDRLTVHHLRLSRPDSPKVLFLGGSSFDLRLKRGFLDTPMGQTCDLATYEPRGIGRTDQPAGTWSMADYAQDALAVLDALEWDKAAVIGESFGGMTALHLTLLAPKRITALVTASATAGGPDHASYDISEYLALSTKDAATSALCLQDTRNKALQHSDPEAFAKRLAMRVSFETAFRTPSVQSGGYARLLAARRTHDCTARLDQIKQPTTVIAGRFDAQARPQAQQALATELPNATFHSFNEGHGVLFNEPTAMSVALNAVTQIKEPFLP